MVLGTLEVFVRSTHVNLARPRWIELSFTREESIQATNKVSLNFGASQDTRGVNMVDSIQVWTRTKEAFGWPEDCVSSQLGGGGGGRGRGRRRGTVPGTSPSVARHPRSAGRPAHLQGSLSQPHGLRPAEARHHRPQVLYCTVISRHHRAQVLYCTVLSQYHRAQEP